MMEEEFDIRKERIRSDQDVEKALRPVRFEDFSGQDKILENLRVFVAAARMRGEALDHTLFYGPPGLGKTTLSNIIANELGVGFKVTSGPVLDKPGDLAGLLTSLEENDVLFIDEIHRLSPVVEEYLYSAMEDYRIDIMIDKGPGARSETLACAIHAHRGHHPQRLAHLATACALRHQLPLGILQPRGAGADCEAFGSIAQRAHHRRGCT